MLPARTVAVKSLRLIDAGAGPDHQDCDQECLKQIVLRIAPPSSGTKFAPEQLPDLLSTARPVCWYMGRNRKPACMIEFLAPRYLPVDKPVGIHNLHLRSALPVFLRSPLV